MSSGYSWDWGMFTQISDDDRPYYQWFIDGFSWTCKVALCALVIAFILGSVLGVMRTTRSSVLRGIGNSYVELFRNIPLIVQLFLWFNVVPELLPTAAGDWVKQSLPGWVIAVIGLCLFTAARISEQVKAGIATLPSGQRMAGLSLGLTEWQTYLHVRLPMAYRIIIPTLTSEAMNIFKNSSVTFAVGVLETFFYAKQVIEKTAQEYEVLIVVALMYMGIALTANLVMGYIEKTTRIPGLVIAKQKGGK
jgi:glutamate/aspartate transport system permease protein